MSENLREMIAKIKMQPQPQEYIGIVHPLQWLWIKWGVHPWFNTDRPESQNMRDQLEAEYNGWT